MIHKTPDEVRKSRNEAVHTFNRPCSVQQPQLLNSLTKYTTDYINEKERFTAFQDCVSQLDISFGSTLDHAMILHETREI